MFCYLKVVRDRWYGVAGKKELLLSLQLFREARDYNVMSGRQVAEAGV